MNNHGSPALPLFDEIRVLARQVVHYVRTAERDPNPAYNIRLAIKCAESLRTSAEELYRGVSSRQRPADLPSQTDCETETPCRIHWSPSRHHRHPTNGPALSAGVPLYNASGTGELLLLVEDETELAELVAEMLGGQGFRVILTPTGQEALQIYKEIGSSIELVIINYLLPDMCGEDLFARLIQIDPAVNVMLASGLLTHHVGAMDIIERLQNNGIRGFIAKPYTRSVLVDGVRSCLATAQSAVVECTTPPDPWKEKGTLLLTHWSLPITDQLELNTSAPQLVTNDQWGRAITILKKLFGAKVGFLGYSSHRLSRISLSLYTVSLVYLVICLVIRTARLARKGWMAAR